MLHVRNLDDFRAIDKELKTSVLVFGLLNEKVSFLLRYNGITNRVIA